MGSIVSVNVTRATRTPTAAGFGTVALFGYHNLFQDISREYGDLSEMVTDGFTTYDPLYLMAAAAFGQSPRPETVLVCKASVSAQSQTVTITDATEGNHIKLDVWDPTSGTWTAIDYTILAAATTSTVATAVELLIEAVTGVASSAAAAVITVTPATGGDLVYLRNPQGCTLADATPDPGYATNLTAAINAGADFYWVATEINSPLAIAAMRAACETEGKIYGWQTQNAVELTAGGSLFSGQAALSPDYGFGFFSKDATQYPQVGAMAWAGTRDPGSYTLSLKEIKGASAVALTTAEAGYLDGDNANYVTTIANGLIGVNGTNGGGITSGGEWIDIIHGTDWWVARTKEAILTVLASTDKVDYTDEGVRALVAAVDGVTKKGVRNGLFKAGYTITAEPVADQDVADRAARHYPGLRVVAEYAGAIHRATIDARFSV